MATTYLYNLDLTGTQPSNKITDEQHVVVTPTQITQASFVVVRACPFYGESIIVKDAKGPTGRVLIKGKDYILTHQSIALSKLTKLPVYGSITFIDRNFTGNVFITYQTVGGEYVPNDYTIVEKLTREKFVLRKTSFDQIVGLPSSYPNPTHQHNPTDLVGLSQLVTAMNDLTAAVRSTQGSYGTLNTIVNAHIKGTAAHTPSQVGLSLLKNYDVALVPDLDSRATNKYLTPQVVADWVNNKLTAARNESINTYLSKADAASLYLNKQSAYTKAEATNLFYNKTYINTNFVTKSNALTEAQVGSIVNQIVNLSQYHTRTEAYGLFYTKEQADTRYYTKSQADAKYITSVAADARYIQTTDSSKIISTLADNTITLRGGKFYTGKLAEDSVLNLYIDCVSGSDSNPGTRTAPLQTLSRANELTPSNKSSTWHIRHYTLDQMTRAASRYTWDFFCSVKAGVTRTLNVYGHTWIDGAKSSQTKQTLNGSYDWRYVNEVERLPIFIKVDTNETSKTQFIYGIAISESSKLICNAIAFIKPFSVGSAYTVSGSWSQNTFFKGDGKFDFCGCYLLTLGAYTEPTSHVYSWIGTASGETSHIMYYGCAFGYTKETIVNGVTTLVNDFTSIFNYSDKAAYPFKYYLAGGSLFVSDGRVPTEAAKINGATAIVNNMGMVLTRPKVISGGYFVNGVCVNISTNIVLQ